MKKKSLMLFDVCDFLIMNGNKKIKFHNAKLKLGKNKKRRWHTKKEKYSIRSFDQKKWHQRFINYL